MILFLNHIEIKLNKHQILLIRGFMKKENKKQSEWMNNYQNYGNENNKQSEENTRLQNEIKSLNNDIKRLKQRYNELDEIRQKASSRAKYCEYELEESKKEIEDLKNVVNEKDEELSDYKRCNQNILRINKERENAKRGLYPKKEHVGYCLRETGPKDYKCYGKAVQI